jgi:hypothetical protein
VESKVLGVEDKGKGDELQRGEQSLVFDSAEQLLVEVLSSQHFFGTAYILEVVEDELQGVGQREPVSVGMLVAEKARASLRALKARTVFREEGVEEFLSFLPAEARKGLLLRALFFLQ